MNLSSSLSEIWGFSDVSIRESRWRDGLDVGYDLDGSYSSKGLLVLELLIELLAVLGGFLDYAGGLVKGFWEFLSEHAGFISSLRILKL